MTTCDLPSISTRLSALQQIRKQVFFVTGIFLNNRDVFPNEEFISSYEKHTQKEAAQKEWKILV
jgi:hypothetical protein